MRRHAPDPSDTDTRPARSIRGRRTIATLLLVGIVLASASIGLVAGGGSTAGTVPAVGDSSSTAESTLVVSDVSTDPDSGATHRIALTEVPDGLAGFELTLVLESDEVATVTGAGYPDRFGMTTDPVVSDDGRTITVEAVDLADEITPDDSDVTLARIEVTGVDDGETELRVVDLQVDADGGSPIEPALEAGTLTVGESGTDGSEPDAAADTNADDDSESDSDSDSDLDSVPGFTLALALLAVIAAIAVISRRT